MFPRSDHIRQLHVIHLFCPEGQKRIQGQKDGRIQLKTSFWNCCGPWPCFRAASKRLEFGWLPWATSIFCPRGQKRQNRGDKKERPGQGLKRHKPPKPAWGFQLPTVGSWNPQADSGGLWRLESRFGLGLDQSSTWQWLASVIFCPRGQKRRMSEDKRRLAGRAETANWAWNIAVSGLIPRQPRSGVRFRPNPGIFFVLEDKKAVQMEQKNPSLPGAGL